MKPLMRTLALAMILAAMITSASAELVPYQTVRQPRINPNVSVGDTITMGRFEQDNNTGNGAEAIEWLVLDVRDGKALVISKYGLTTSYYGNNYIWETSEIRRWLNGTFMNQVFSAEELVAIETTAVDNSGAQHYSGYSVPGTSTTMEKLFLLSYAEASIYFRINIEGQAGNVNARAAATAYARAKDPSSAAVSSDQRTAEGKTAGKWWLRSPGARNSCAIYITPEGTAGYNYTNTWRNLVRPAMWIGLTDNAEQKDTVSLSIGDSIMMGRFEQDNNTGNGAEAIEWLVLDVRDGKALVISKYGLITSYYGNSYVWETSEIRRWLNGTFLNQVFSAEELVAIETTAVDNSGAQHYSGYSIPGTSTTMDKLFLLSYAEASIYFRINIEGQAGNVNARAAATAYARAKDPSSAAVSSDQRTAEGKTAGKWWLRSPGARTDCAIYITPEGTAGYNYTNTWRNLIRPAMWVDLVLLPRT